MKKIILTAVAVFAFANGYSQKEGGFRVGLDLGYTVPSNGGGGILFSIEPKYNIKDNMNVGLRFGAAAMVRDIETNGSTNSAKISANGSYVGTYDYYFNKSGTSFVQIVVISTYVRTISRNFSTTSTTISFNITHHCSSTNT